MKRTLFIITIFIAIVSVSCWQTGITPPPLWVPSVAFGLIAFLYGLSDN